MPARSAFSQDEWIEETGSLIGKITDIDLGRSVVTVAEEAEDGRTIEAKIDEEFTFIGKGGEFITIEELKTGELVEMEYHKEGERFSSDWIELLDYEEEIELPPELKIDMPEDFIPEGMIEELE